MSRGSTVGLSRTELAETFFNPSSIPSWYVSHPLVPSDRTLPRTGAGGGHGGIKSILKDLKGLKGINPEDSTRFLKAWKET